MNRYTSLSDKKKGFVFAFFGVLAITPDSLFIRLPDVDNLDFLFFRYLYGSSAFLLFLLLKDGGRKTFKRVLNFTIWDILGIFAMAIQSLSFSLATRLVGSANALVIFAVFPMTSSLVSYVLLKETQTRATVIAMVLSFATIFYVFCADFLESRKAEQEAAEEVADDLNQTSLEQHHWLLLVTEDNFDSNESDGLLDQLDEVTERILGNFLALMGTFFLSVYFVLGRRRMRANSSRAAESLAIRVSDPSSMPSTEACEQSTTKETIDVDPLAYNIFTGPIIMLTVFGLGARLESVTEDFLSLDNLYLFIGGFFVFSTAFGLLTYSTKFLSAPIVSLLMLFETILGPLCVFLVLGEEPETHTLIGGAVLCVILITYNVNLLCSTDKESDE